jgi:uncharacterized ferredoxin-like protein
VTDATSTNAEKLSIEDVRRKAERVEEIAREEVDHFVHRDATRYAIYGAVAVLAVVGLAYYMGARAGGRRFASRAALPPSE